MGTLLEARNSEARSKKRFSKIFLASCFLPLASSSANYLNYFDLKGVIPNE